jgi:hypothetical protein
MTALDACKQAKYIFEHRSTSDREQRINNVIALNEWHLFSNAQLSRLTGLKEHDVAAYTGKTDKTGGNFEGEALAPIIELIHLRSRGERDDRVVRRALEHASSRMVARLSGFSQSYISRAGRRAA